MKFTCAFLLLALLVAETARSENVRDLCTDRAAIERIYYSHRPGVKPAFEEVLPLMALENLVRQDLRRETLLKQNYGIEITDAKLAAEANRLSANTRTPALLAEIKAALGHDPARFANAFVRPILVDRRLHEIFDNDDQIHAPQRRLAELTRRELLAAKTNGADCETLLALLKRDHSNAVTEITWQLDPPSVETNALSGDDAEIKQRFDPNLQNPSAPPACDGRMTAFYFQDLPGELQQMLRAQLRQPGDVSTVIETPGCFLLYVTETKTTAALCVVALSLPKCGYEEWLQAQSESQP